MKCMVSQTKISLNFATNQLRKKILHPQWLQKMHLGKGVEKYSKSLFC